MIKNTSGLVATFVVARGASGWATPVAVPFDPVIGQGVAKQVSEVAMESPACNTPHDGPLPNGSWK